MTSIAPLENVDAVYPLSPMQLGMLYHVVANPQDTVYLNQSQFDIVGELDVDAFRSAWDELVERHDALRSGFIWDGVDRPLQIVRSEVELEWRIVEAGPHDEVTIEALLESDRERGLSVADAPLMRMALLRMSETRWRWIWVCHHLIADAWSVQVLLQELQIIYRSIIEGTSPDLLPTFKYRDFLASTIDEHLQQEAEEYWTHQLAGFSTPMTLEVPGRPVAAYLAGHSSYVQTLTTDASQQIEYLARNLRVTVNTVVSAAWALVLSRWGRTNDVVFGATSAGRDPALRGIEDAVGLFIATLPQRFMVDPDRPVAEWLSDIHEQLLDARRYEHTPLASIQKWSDVSSGEDLFQSLLVFENVAIPDAHASRNLLSIEPVQFNEFSNYPLALLVTPASEMRFEFIYEVASLHPDAIASLGRQLATVLASMADDPSQPLSAISLIGASEATNLEGLSTGPDLAFDGRTVDAIVADMAQERPDHPAAVLGDSAVTYGELDRQANSVARYLASMGAGPGQLVGIHLARSLDMIVAMIGVLKSGAAYVPLDPAYPPHHIQRIINDDKIQLIVASVDSAPDVGGTATLVWIDEASASSQSTAPNMDLDDDRLAYVIHTSGSTGRPKGVGVTHRNLVQSTVARNSFYPDPVERFLLLSSFSFDSSVAGIYWSLFSGGTLVLPPPGAEHDIDAIASTIKARGVSHILCLPAVYRLLLDHAKPGDLDTLTTAIVAGEASPSELVDRHLAVVPNTALHNEYGPTEATVWCTAHTASREDLGRQLPIGRPIPGASIRLLDAHRNDVPAGFAGEMYVGGLGVTPGYINDQDLTDERFTPLGNNGDRSYRTGDLAAFNVDGTLRFLGRADQQLKIRGHRIEPSAVETAVVLHRDVISCAVDGRRAHGRDSDLLIAYITTLNGAIDADDLRSELRELIPSYMVPDVVMVLDQLPYLPNGKLDYASLPEPDEFGDVRANYVAPSTDAERALADIWSSLLGVDTIGIHDDFFALGGDSIVSIQMVSRARQEGLPVLPGQIVTNPTIASLAARAESQQLSPVDQSPIVGEVGLSPIQRWFFDTQVENYSQWNQSALFEVPSDLDHDAIQAALQAVVAHHDMLRGRFHRTEDGWTQHLEQIDRVPFDILEVATEEVDAVVARAQEKLDVVTGPIIRATLLRCHGGPDLLLVVVHHLVVDVVSWTILADDLETAYVQSVEGAPIQLPMKTDSYKTWVRHLHDLRRSNDAGFWIKQASRIQAASDRSDPGIESATDRITTTFDRSISDAFLQRANDAYQTRPEDLLVAALGAAVASRDDTSEGWLAMEGHGRPAEVDGIDLTRTVGWFTAQYPVAVPVGTDSGRVLKETKERLRQIVDGGVGFGVLRYLERDPDIGDLKMPEVNLNYVGRTLDSSEDGLLRWIDADPVGSRHPDARRAFPVEVIASITNDILELAWSFSVSRYDRSTIEMMAQHAEFTLIRLIEHCLEDSSGGFTPSDFPEVGLAQDELDDLLAEL